MPLNKTLVMSANESLIPAERIEHAILFIRQRKEL